MPDTFQDLQQGTEEWKQARLGKVTASRLKDVLAKTKSGYSASRANYLAELICERLTDTPTEHFVSKEMQWGIDHEDEARAAYEERAGVFVQEVGFVTHPDIPDSGASPDGFVGADGGVEIKCPNTATHIETLLSGTADSRYLAQMQWNMACTGRKWWDFVSYDPRMPVGLQLFVKRVLRDDSFIADAISEVSEFLLELEKKTQALRELADGRDL